MTLVDSLEISGAIHIEITTDYRIRSLILTKRERDALHLSSTITNRISCDLYATSIPPMEVGLGDPTKEEEIFFSFSSCSTFFLSFFLFGTPFFSDWFRSLTYIHKRRVARQECWKIDERITCILNLLCHPLSIIHL